MDKPDTNKKELFKKLLAEAKEITCLIDKYPEFRKFPGYDDLVSAVVKLMEKEGPAIPLSEWGGDVHMAEEIAPVLWMGLFQVTDMEGQPLMEIPLGYQVEDGRQVMSYTYSLEQVPDLVRMCQSISQATGYSWRLLEYRAETELNPLLFGHGGFSSTYLH